MTVAKVGVGCDNTGRIGTSAVAPVEHHVRTVDDPIFDTSEATRSTHANDVHAISFCPIWSCTD